MPEHLCPLALNSTHTSYAIPLNSTAPFQLTPSPDEGIPSLATWNGIVDVAVHWPQDGVFRGSSPVATAAAAGRGRTSAAAAAILAERILNERDQARGVIGVELSNSDDQARTVIWRETWPWWLRTYVHTLAITDSASASSSSIQGGSEAGGGGLVVRDLTYVPALARERPTTLELELMLPPRSRHVLTFEYECAFLWYAEYPADAHRGLDIPGATIISATAEGRRRAVTIHTRSAVLALATPDFSMPYNVIIMTSTVVALFFGSVFNALTRKHILVHA